MRRAALLALAAAGCSVDLGEPQPWQPAAAIGGAFAIDSAAPPVAAAVAPDARIRVVSFNVLSGTDVDALARAFTDTPALSDADIVLVQEIEAHPGEGGSRTARLAARLGMGHVYAPERLQGDGTLGQAILSVLPLENVAVMELPFADLAVSSQRRIALAADVRVAGQLWHLVNVHLDTRLNAVDRILQLRPAVIDARALSIVGGDFNTNPYLWAGSVVPQLDTAAVADTDQALVLDDYMRHLGFDTPTAGLGTTRPGVVDARLDAVYTRGVASRPGAVERSITVSDHQPVWIDIELAAGR